MIDDDPAQLGAPIINVDHHHDNPGWGHWNLVDGEASSTAEMVVRVAERVAGIGARQVVVAADDPRILAACEAHGVKVPHVGWNSLERLTDAPIIDGVADGAQVGTVTSGTLSPTLGRGIALAYVAPEHAHVGARLGIDVRGKEKAAEVTSLPFVDTSPRKEHHS